MHFVQRNLSPQTLLQLGLNLFVITVGVNEARQGQRREQHNHDHRRQRYSSRSTFWRGHVALRSPRHPYHVALRSRLLSHRQTFWSPARLCRLFLQRQNGSVLTAFRVTATNQVTALVDEELRAVATLDASFALE